MRARGGYFDLNVTYGARVLWALHYPYPWLCGYRWMDKPGGGRRKVPWRRRHWSIDRWGSGGMARLSRRNGERPLTLDDALELCAELGACPIKETKSRAFARSDRPWQLLLQLCEHHDVPTWSKALVTMWGFKGKVVRAKRVGVPLAAIYGKGVRGRARRLARTRRIERGWRDGTRVYRTW